MPRKYFNLSTLVILATNLISACTIHPSIVDVTNYNAYDIERKARCEVREVLIAKLAQYLSRQAGDSTAQEVGDQLMKNPDSIRAADFRRFSKNTQDVINRVSKSAVALDFTLNITESNSGSGGLGISTVFPSGSRALGLSAGVDLTRNNVSTFFVTDTFIDLLTKIEPIYCYKYNFYDGTYTKLDTTTKNFAYPMAGNIGLAKSIDVFVNMSLFGNLGSKDTKVPPTMSDALEFTTRITAAANPSLTFLPGVPGTRLASASLTASSYREDKHKVIVGLSVPPDDPKLPNAVDVFTGQIVTVNQRATSAEVRAANAVSQHILRFEIGQRNPAPIVVQSLFPLF